MRKTGMLMLLFLAFFSCKQKEEVKLEGKYKIEFIKDVEAFENTTEEEFYIIFSDSTFTSRLNCNSIQGAFALNNGAAKFDVLISTRMMCPDNTESKYLMAISETEAVELEGEHVSFKKGDEILLKIHPLK